jgi:heme/copper-type cytochrome/quinol oxidase subunit 2
MKKIFPVSLLLALLITPLPVLAAAATPYTVENLGGSVGLGSADLKTTVINIIQWVLGILALVAVVMIIVSIIVAATASDDERVERAKKGIFGALIGLIIVLIAWAIVIFVAGTFTNVVK